MDVVLQTNLELAKFSSNLKKHFIKLASRGFGAYLCKEIDKIVKNICDGVISEHFGEFAPNALKIPFCVLAAKNYAQNTQIWGEKIEILIIYKKISGFNMDEILRSLLRNLNAISNEQNQPLFLGQNQNISAQNLDANLTPNFKIHAQIFELDEIFIKSEFRDFFFKIRLIFGSKLIYKMAKDEISRLKDSIRSESLREIYENLKPFNDIEFLKINSDLNSGYGGINEIFLAELAAAIFGENTKQIWLNFIDENEFAELTLSLDNIVCIQNSLALFGEKKIKQNLLEQIGEILQTKEKKSLSTDLLIMQKMLNSMHNIALFSRFLVQNLYKNFAPHLSATKDESEIYGDFWVQNNIVYAPAQKRGAGLKKIILDLALLPDIALKFDISAIIYLRRFEPCDVESCMHEFRKIFTKTHLYYILKALLNSEILFFIVKPMSHTRYLAQFPLSLGVDDRSVLSLYYLENLNDEFIAKLYANLDAKDKIMLKLVFLMHDVGTLISDDHESLGANIFRAYASKFGLNIKETNYGVTLIKYHNLMQKIVRGEDIYNQRVIFSFISKMPQKPLLAMSYILTYCSLLAAEDGKISAYLARILREFYDICEENLGEKNLISCEMRRIKKENSIKRLDEFERLDEPTREAIFKIPSSLFFTKYSPIEILQIVDFAKNGDINFGDENSSIKIITQPDANIANLLDKFVQYDLIYMEIFELFDEKVFIKLEYNHPFFGDKDELKAKIQSALKSKEQSAKFRPEILKSEINFNLKHSKFYAELGINAKNQAGLMAYVMGVFKEFNIKIVSAKVQTIKDRTRNLFLIQKSGALDLNYKKIVNLLINKGE